MTYYHDDACDCPLCYGWETAHTDIGELLDVEESFDAGEWNNTTDTSKRSGS